MNWRVYANRREEREKLERTIGDCIGRLDAGLLHAEGAYLLIIGALNEYDVPMRVQEPDDLTGDEEGGR